jgi:nucleotide-binding universal stress UspA family protein
VRMEPAPIVVAVDDSRPTEAAAQSGVRLARELGAPVVFVYVRRGPWSGLAAPHYQRRLDAELSAGRSA